MRMGQEEWKWSHPDKQEVEEEFNYLSNLQHIWRKYIQTIGLSLSLRANKKKSFDFPSYEKSLLTTNYYLKEQYTIAVGNKFETLQADSNEQSLSKTYNDFISFHERVEAHVITFKT